VRPPLQPSEGLDGLNRGKKLREKTNNNGERGKGKKGDMGLELGAKPETRGAKESDSREGVTGGK